MKNVLTLISNPAEPVLTAAIVADCGARMVDVTAISWLSEGVAADIFFDGDIVAAEEKLGPELMAKNLDFLFQPQQNRVKKLLVADMDSTIIQCECIDELADFAGLKEEISAMTEAAMQGNVDFEQTLRDRVALLAGLEATALEKMYRERLALTPGAVPLIRTMNAKGAMTVLVSGGFTFFTGKVAALTGFQVNRGNILEISDGRLTGKVLPPIVDSRTKIDSLIEFRNKGGLSKAETLAIGDGANDIPMIREAGLGVAFHPKPAVEKAADMVIRHADLTALLYLQGYSDQDFVR